jgi:hypothetical protein
MVDRWKGQVQKAKAQEKLNYCAMKIHPCLCCQGFWNGMDDTLVVCSIQLAKYGFHFRLAFANCGLPKLLETISNCNIF